MLLFLEILQVLITFIGEQYEFEYTFSQQYLALGATSSSGSRTRVREAGILN